MRRKRAFTTIAKAAAKKAKLVPLTIASWNIWGLRARLKDGSLLKFLENENPDICAFNETMLQGIHIEDIEKQLPVDYYKYWTCSTAKKGYSGVGVLSKIEPQTVTYGIGQEKYDSEGRVVTAEFPNFFFVANYVPNAGAGLKRHSFRVNEWDLDIRNFIMELQQHKPVVWCGDMNVVHLDIDIHDIKNKEGWACLTPEERSGFGEHLEQANLVDTFREQNPEIQGWSYFPRRNVGARKKGQGWRLDYILVSRSLFPNVISSSVRSDIMGSDHHPCFIELQQ